MSVVPNRIEHSGVQQIEGVRQQPHEAHPGNVEPSKYPPPRIPDGGDEDRNQCGSLHRIAQGLIEVMPDAAQAKRSDQDDRGKRNPEILDPRGGAGR